MKHNIYLAIFVLVLGAMAAAGQSNGDSSQPKQWTYKADNGLRGRGEEVIIIIITQRPNGYEVGGELRWGKDPACSIRGTYFPSTKRLRARCNTSHLDGFKIQGKDAIQLSEPFAAVATRVGAKPTPNSDKNTAPPTEQDKLSGTWKVRWTDPYAYYDERWEVRASGKGKWLVTPTLLDTNHQYNRRLIGTKGGEITLTADGAGKLQLARSGGDSNPGAAGHFEQTGTGTYDAATLTIEGMRKGASLTHPFIIKGKRENK